MTLDKRVDLRADKLKLYETSGVKLDIKYWCNVLPMLNNLYNKWRSILINSNDTASFYLK